MNGLEEIREYVGNFVVEKGQVQKQIGEIEEKRTQLAQQRNEKKKVNSNDVTVYELGRQICELGNQSQELQRKLDFKNYEIKEQVNLIIDSILIESIRRISMIYQEINELEVASKKQIEIIEKYLFQRREFYVRFGRMPELSERAKNEIKLQKKRFIKMKIEIHEMVKKMEQIGQEISDLEIIKKQFKKGNWEVKLEKEDSKEITIKELIEQETVAIVDLIGTNFSKEITIEELIEQETAKITELIGTNSSKEITIEELIEQETAAIVELIGTNSSKEITIEELIKQETAKIVGLDIEELYVEEFEPIEEIEIEEFHPEEIIVEEFVPLEQISTIDEIEELARNIVEEIATEQTKGFNINKIEESEEKNIEANAESGIVFEKEENAPKSKVIIPLFGKNDTISTIIVKIEDGELVYKAQMSDEEDIKIYPSKLSQESVLLRDKQNRAECAEILKNYAIGEYKTFDKKVINQIDPLVCELLIECAGEYGYNAQELIYDYAMSFSNNLGCDIENVPAIIYNLSYIETSNLSLKERTIIKKICKNARKNEKVDIIESFTGFNKIKYVLKRIFAINNVNVLPEGNINKN